MNSIRVDEIHINVYSANISSDTFIKGLLEKRGGNSETTQINVKTD